MEYPESDWIDNSLRIVSRDSSISIATDYGLDGPGIESRWRRDFPLLSRPALGPTQPPVQWAMGTGSFPGIKSGRGVTLTPHPLLVPWSRKNRAIPLLPLWAVRPVQSLCACTRVHFTFTFNLRINLEHILQFCVEATCGYVLSEENCSTNSS